MGLRSRNSSSPMSSSNNEDALSPANVEETKSTKKHKHHSKHHHHSKTKSGSKTKKTLSASGGMLGIKEHTDVNVLASRTITGETPTEARKHHHHHHHHKSHSSSHHHAEKRKSKSSTETRKSHHHKHSAYQLFDTNNAKHHLPGELENIIHLDAASLLNQFQTTFKEVNKKLRKANVLITGVAGAGKSSIINSVFGKELAATSVGKPVTQCFQKFESDNIILYDSKGLEAGRHVEFIEDTRNFLASHTVSKKGDSSKCIHAIWYIVNSAGSRFYAFEEELCRTLFNNIPIIFILSKADISNNEEREELRQTLVDLNLPNLIGIYDTVSLKHCSTQCMHIEVCPVCKSDELTIKNKQKMAICDSCGIKTPLSLDTKLDVVAKATLRALPSVAREAFINAQNVNFTIKRKRAGKIISEFFVEYSHVHLSGGLLKIMAKMITRLSILWDFKQHGHLYGIQIARNIVGEFTFRDKLFLFMHKSTHQVYEATALGILWNDCVCNLAQNLFNTFQKSSEANWDVLLENTFSSLTIENIDKIASDIESTSLNDVLKERNLSSSDEDDYLFRTQSMPGSPVMSPLSQSPRSHSPGIPETEGL